MFKILKRGITKVKEDIQVIYDKDPAANNILEVILCYPGLHALIAYRFAHRLYKWHIPLVPRMISYLTRIITGIEIHPAAKIGRRFFIDHGEGVVIGATTIIGDDVLIYQQVTLGGTGKEHGKRHPTLGNGVIVGAGAKVLGNIKLGDYVRVGAGSVVMEDVPEYSTVVGVPGRIVQRKIKDENGVLMHNRIPDPIKCELNRLKYEVMELKEKINKEMKMYHVYTEKNHSEFSKTEIAQCKDYDTALQKAQKAIEGKEGYNYIIEETDGSMNSYGELISRVVAEG